MAVMRGSEHGSKSAEEMRARMQAAGYEDWEIEDEIADAAKLSRENRRNTELFRRTGAFRPPDPPVLRAGQRQLDSARTYARAPSGPRTGGPEASRKEGDETMEEEHEMAEAGIEEGPQSAARFIPYENLTEEVRALVDSEDWNARVIAAQRGFALDKLVDDPYPEVRRLVALRGYGLDRFVDDPDHEVREAVALQGYGLDKLVDDQSWKVRGAVADQGYGLDKLIDDPDDYVRWAVVSEGYGLDKLVDDPEDFVRMVVQYKLDREGYPDVRAWAEANPDKCALPENRPSDPAAPDPDPFRELAPEEAAMVGSPYPEVRREAAEAGLGIWTLLGDDDKSVRLAAAKAAAKGIDADGIGADAVEDESDHIIIAFDTMKERSGLSEHEISIDYDLDAGRFSGDAVEHGERRELSGEEVMKAVAAHGLAREVGYAMGRFTEGAAADGRTASIGDELIHPEVGYIRAEAIDQEGFAYASDGTVVRLDKCVVATDEARRRFEAGDATLFEEARSASERALDAPSPETTREAIREARRSKGSSAPASASPAQEQDRLEAASRALSMSQARAAQRQQQHCI